MRLAKDTGLKKSRIVYMVERVRFRDQLRHMLEQGCDILVATHQVYFMKDCVSRLERGRPKMRRKRYGQASSQGHSNSEGEMAGLLSVVLRLLYRFIIHFLN